MASVIGSPLADAWTEPRRFLVEAFADEAMERSEAFGELVRQSLTDTPVTLTAAGCTSRSPLPERQQDVQDTEQLILIRKKPPRKKQTTNDSPRRASLGEPS